MASIPTMPSISTQYVRSAKRRARRDGTDLTLSDFPVQMALVDGVNEPNDAQWGTASWETDNGREYAKVLVGPLGVLDPGAGLWTVWIDVDVTPERVRQPVGKIRIT